MVERIDRQVEIPARPPTGLDAVERTYVTRLQLVIGIRSTANRLASALK
jgi:hypothetical protein